MRWSHLHTVVVSGLLILVTLDYVLVQLSFSGGLRLEDVVTTMATPARSWEATSLPNQSVRIDTLGITPLETESFFLFGPYVPVVAGTYELKLDGSAHRAGTLIRGELAGEKGGTVYHSFEVTSDQLPFQRSFELPNVSQLEVRLRAEQPGGVTLSRLTLKRKNISWRAAVSQTVRSAIGLRRSLFSLQFY